MNASPAQIVNTVGLLLVAIGAFILFRITPTKAQTGGFSPMYDVETARQMQAASQRLRIPANTGFALIVIGSVLQIIGTWLPAADPH